MYANTDIVLEYCPTQHHRLVIVDSIDNSNNIFVIVLWQHMKHINSKKIYFTYVLDLQILEVNELLCFFTQWKIPEKPETLSAVFNIAGHPLPNKCYS